MHIHYDPIARDLQEQVCQILNSDSQVSAMATFFAEQSLDVDYEVRKSLASQGLAAIVMTPTLTLLGHDGVTTSWQCDDLTLQIIENPIVNRARLKNLGLSSGTALDVAEVAAECLAGPQGGHFGEYSAKQVQTAEQNNLLVVKATFKTTCSRQLSSIISSDTEGHTVEIPFATRDELNLLSSDVMQISASFESFSTEEIKEDISSLYNGQEALSSRFDNLSAIFQPKGDYAAASSLTAYALKADVPTKTSQLANDSGYITSDEVTPSPTHKGFASGADAAVTALYAQNALVADEVDWANVTGKPDLNALSANALAEANKHSDQNLVIAEGYASDIADGVRVWTGENFIYRASIDLPTEPKYQGYVSKAVSADSVASIEWDKVEGKPEIPAKTSQLVNDSGYITSADVKPSEDYEGYALNAQNAVNALNATTAGYADNAGAAPWDGITGKPNLALKTDVPTKTSQLENDSGYLNEVSLSNYVTKDELPSLEGYVSQDYVDNKVGQEATARQTADQQLRESIDQKADISSVPTKTSDLVNDSGYLTAHQSLSNYYTKEQTDEKIAEKQDAYALFSRNDQQKIEGDRLVYRLSADEWVNIGELALKSDMPSTAGLATTEYVDENVGQEAAARQAADQELRASIAEKADIDQIPTKTSQLENDSNFLTAHQSLSDYYTKQQTDEAISSALSSAGNSKYIESEDGTQRIYGNGDVGVISSTPGTYGPWTDEDGNVDNTWRVVEISAGVFCYIHGDDASQRSIETWTSREEAEKATTFRTQGYEKVWTRTYTPGPESFVKEGELALKSDLSSIIDSIDKHYIESEDGKQRIYGNRDVSVLSSTGTYGPWTNAVDGTVDETWHVVEAGANLWCWENSLGVRSQSFYGEETALQANAFQVQDTNEVWTRTYTPGPESWVKEGELALKSDITQSGISEDEARTLIQSYDYVTNDALNSKGFRTYEQVETQITSKGYQTQTQVETQITSKGYVTQTQVETQITSKGYRTESQVDAQIEAKGYVTSAQAQQIAAGTLPTGYAQTEVVGTLEDGTEVHFYILTKEI